LDRSVVPFVLAAGFGNRLRPLTDVLPKPAVPLLGLPMVGHVLARVRRSGFDRAVLNTHHLSGPLQAEVTAWRDEHCADLQLAYSVELPDILGTGGALVAARRLIGASATAIVNGDILCDFDLPALVEHHRRSGAVATLLLAEHPDVETFGAIVADDAGRVLDLAGLASRTDDAKGGRSAAAAGRGVFSGVHIVDEAVFDFLPRSGFACIVRQGYVPMMKAGLDVRAVFHRGTWNDLGTLERYLQTHFDLLDQGFLAGSAASLVEPDGIAYGIDGAGVEYGDSSRITVEPGAVLRPPVALGAGSVVATGATLGPHAVLGTGVEIGPRSTVQRTVAWPGTRVDESARLDGGVCYLVGDETRVAGSGTDQK
jgi:mannose-1-phosphate guanylyltransferase